MVLQAAFEAVAADKFLVSQAAPAATLVPGGAVTSAVGSKLRVPSYRGADEKGVVGARPAAPVELNVTLDSNPLLVIDARKSFYTGVDGLVSFMRAGTT